MIAQIWNLSLNHSGKWSVDLVKRLNHVDTSREDGANFSASITCILPMAQVVYTGDDGGKVVSFDPFTPLFLRCNSEGDAPTQAFIIRLNRRACYYIYKREC